MKRLFILLNLCIVVISCNVKPSDTNADLWKILKDGIPDLCKNSEVYVVHPENCGACSVSLIQKIVGSEDKDGCIFIISTSVFSTEYDSIIDSKDIYYFDGDSLYRKGVSPLIPQKISIRNNTIELMEKAL